MRKSGGSGDGVYLSWREISNAGARNFEMKRSPEDGGGNRMTRAEKRQEGLQVRSYGGGKGFESRTAGGREKIMG